MCKFIEDYYVENDLFRLFYTPEKFKWAVMTPGWSKDYHFCIRNSKNKKLMAIMFGCPKKYFLNEKKIKMLEGNFFAIHRALRNKRLAPIMV